MRVHIDIDRQRSLCSHSFVYILICAYVASVCLLDNGVLAACPEAYLDVGAKCTSQSTCKKPAFCGAEGKCILPRGGKQECTSITGTPGKCSAGLFCSRDGNTNRYVCLEELRKGQFGCEQTADCARALVCSRNSDKKYGTCKSQGAVTEGESALRVEECAYGLILHDGICKKAPEVACISDEVCKHPNNKYFCCGPTQRCQLLANPECDPQYRAWIQHKEGGIRNTVGVPYVFDDSHEHCDYRRCVHSKNPIYTDDYVVTCSKAPKVYMDGLLIVVSLLVGVGLLW